MSCVVATQEREALLTSVPSVSLCQEPSNLPECVPVATCPPTNPHLFSFSSFHLIVSILNFSNSIEKKCVSRRTRVWKKEKDPPTDPLELHISFVIEASSHTYCPPSLSVALPHFSNIVLFDVEKKTQQQVNKCNKQYLLCLKNSTSSRKREELLLTKEEDVLLGQT